MDQINSCHQSHRRCGQVHGKHLFIRREELSLVPATHKFISRSTPGILVSLSPANGADFDMLWILIIIIDKLTPISIPYFYALLATLTQNYPFLISEPTLD